MQIMPRAWVVLVFIVTISFACGPTPSPPSPYQPVASVRQLMIDVIDPAAYVVWDSVGTIVSADGIEELISVGVNAIIQPGGSINDKKVIETANKAGVIMAFTGTRHFKH